MNTLFFSHACRLLLSTAAVTLCLNSVASGGWFDGVVIAPDQPQPEFSCVGAVDGSFGNVRIATDHNEFWPGRIAGMVVQTGGKVVIAGQFLRIQGTWTPALARLNTDGTLDPTFSHFQEEDYVTAFIAQPDGKLLLGGQLGQLGSVSVRGLIRLNQDGSVDSGFALTNMFFSVEALALQTDGKILVSTLRVPVHEEDPPYTVLRLNVDGSFDPTFNFTASVWEPIGSLVSLQDGSFLFNGTNRCAANGVLDAEFKPDVGAIEVRAALQLHDGKLLFAGRYGLQTNGPGPVVRVHLDGSRDWTFQCPPIVGDIKYGGLATVMALVESADGKIYAAGSFGGVDSTPVTLVARLNEDGSLDPSFRPAIEFCAGCDEPEFVNRIALAPNDTMMISGPFKKVNGLNRGNVARLHLAPNACSGIVTAISKEVLVNEDAGQVQITFARGGNTNSAASVAFTTRDETEWWQNADWFSPAFPLIDYMPQSSVIHFAPGETVQTVSVPVLNNYILQPNRYFFLELKANASTVLGPAMQTRVVILDDESAGRPGSLDLQFQPQVTWAPYNMATVDLAGRIVLTDSANYMNDLSCLVRRLNPSGSIDPGFSAAFVDSYVLALATDSSNRVLIAGAFLSVNGVTRNRIARLLPDGGIDPAFSASVNGAVGDILLLNGGKIVISGAFTEVNGASRAGIARLLPDGELDTSFDPEGGPLPLIRSDHYPHPITSLAVQGDGRLIVCGGFRSFGEADWGALVRLEVDGKVDMSFLPAFDTTYQVDSVVVQPDDKILVVGAAGSARLNADGSRDEGFNPPVMNIGSFALQPDGKIIVNSRFRLNPDGSVDPSFYTGSAGPYSPGPILPLPNGNILVWGQFDRFNEVSRPGLAVIRGGTLAEGPGRIEFTAHAAGVSETNAAVTVTVRRQDGAIGDATVHVYTQNGTARADVDYSPASHWITFPNGAAGDHPITIPIINNSEAVGVREFFVNLAVPAGDVIAGPQTRFVVRIDEDDVGVQVQTNDLWRLENEVATVTLFRVGPIKPSFSVHLSVTPGTAEAGVDFVPVETNVVFAADEYWRWVPIQVVPDNVPEPDKSVVLTLSNPTGGARIAGQNPVEMWIADDDRLPCVARPHCDSVGFTFALDFPVNTWISLESSTNLVDWEYVGGYFRGAEMPRVLEAPATNSPMRFYRLSPQ